MLDLFEKIGAGIAALLVLVTLGLYLFLGPPSHKSLLWIPKVQKDRAEPEAKAVGPGGAAAVSKEDQAIVDKLAEQERKVTPAQIEKENLVVPQELFEFVSGEANLLGELGKAKSSPIRTKNGDTRLQIRGVQQESVLGKLGFQDNDVIELIDGNIISFDKKSTSQYYGLWEDAKERLRSGQPVTVTVTRQNRLMHIKFRL